MNMKLSIKRIILLIFSPLLLIAILIDIAFGDIATGVKTTRKQKLKDHINLFKKHWNFNLKAKISDLEKKIQENEPPMHLNCRSIIAGSVTGKDIVAASINSKTRKEIFDEISKENKS